VRRPTWSSTTEKPAARQAFSFFYSISSEYQIETRNRPNIFEVIVVEVVWNEGQHFRTVRGKLDKFSTFGDFSEKSTTESTEKDVD
jgi:hypothetical protein